MRNIEYDDSNLHKLYAELEPKRRRQALKGGLRRAANMVRKAAVVRLRTSLKSNRDLERGVRALVFKRVAGFRVTVGTGRRGESIHTNRWGKKKPVLIWAEDGTQPRYRRSKRRALRLGSGRGGFSGSMPRLGFMADTSAEMGPKVTEILKDETVKSVRRIALKYGGT